MSEKKPNIILIMTDQHRFDCLGCYHHPVIETPNIDWLASEGTVFDAAYSPSPSCIPARACLMTGMTPWNAGILGMGEGQGPMGLGFEATLPGELAKFGYYTKGVGKMHFYPQRSLMGFHSTTLDESGRVEDKNFVSDYMKWFSQQKKGDYSPVDHGLGWNSWMARPYHLPEYLHPTNWTVNEAVRFLETRDPSMPYFLKVSFARPHSPYDPPQHFYDLYKDAPVPEPAVGDWAKAIDIGRDGAYFDAWRGKRSKEETRRARASYYGEISHIDNQIGRLLIWLKDHGELENTLFIFTSDHGDMLGDHNLWRKTYAYEGSAHIPMIIKLPKHYRTGVEERVKAPVSLFDIMPTLLDFVSAPIPESVEGESLMPLLYGKAEGFREILHGEHCQCYAPEQEMQYLTDGRYKYIWLPRLDEEQLFDLEADPMEYINVAQHEEYRRVLERFRRSLVDILDKRDNGLVKEGRLIGQKGLPPQISPHYQKRLEASEFDWLASNQNFKVKI